MFPQGFQAWSSTRSAIFFIASFLRVFPPFILPRIYLHEFDGNVLKKRSFTRFKDSKWIWGIINLSRKVRSRCKTDNKIAVHKEAINEFESRESGEFCFNVYNPYGHQSLHSIFLLGFFLHTNSRIQHRTFHCLT